MPDPVVTTERDDDGQHQTTDSIMRVRPYPRSSPGFTELDLGAAVPGPMEPNLEPNLEPDLEDAAPPPELPDALARIVDRFGKSPKDFRVQALLHFGRKLPPLPPEFSGDRSLLEQVHECQTPFFLATRVDGEGRVRLFFDAPAESPTVRGFAGILREGLEGAHWQDVLLVPADFYATMKLEEVVSPLRLRGMAAILARLKRQVREAVGEVG